jgi:hypothetical protein
MVSGAVSADYKRRVSVVPKRFPITKRTGNGFGGPETISFFGSAETMSETDHIRHPETQRPLSGCSAAADAPQKVAVAVEQVLKKLNKNFSPDINIFQW